MPSPTDSPAAAPDVELALEGMTCAACAARIEKRLNRLDGVSATVNLATEKARVTSVGAVSTADLIGAVEAAGYHARLIGAPSAVSSSTVSSSTVSSSSGSPSAAGSAAPRTAEPADPVRRWRRRLVASVVLTLPVVALAMVPAWQFPGWQWVSLLLATPVVAWGGRPFHRAAVVNLRHGGATMDTLISLGTLAAYGWSLYALVLGSAGTIGMTHPPELFGSRGGGGDAIYLEAAAGITTFLLIGRYLEARSKRAAGAALRALLELGAKQASVLRDGVETAVPIAEVVVGDLFVVRPGDKVATDGVVVEGRSAVDVSLLTGEAVPVEVGPGDDVVGASVNASGRLLVRASRVGADTQLAQLGRLVEQAQSGKAPVQRLADRVSAVFVPVVIALAVLTLAGWVVAGRATGSDTTWTDAFTAAVAVLIIACPCALGLATPTALLVGTGRGAQLGLVISGPEILENTRRVDTVLLDKTGTVTTGRLQVDTVRSIEPALDPDSVLGLAAALQGGSEHPIGKAVVRAAGAGADSPAVTDFANHAGLGVSGTVDGARLACGRRGFLVEQGIAVDDAVVAAQAGLEAQGRTVVLLGRRPEGHRADGQPGRVLGLIALADTPKQTSAAAVADLRALGLHPVLLTGDNHAVAARVAAEVGIDDVHAEVLPADKVALVRSLQDAGRTVAMVGDGVNDAAALAQADLGVAMGAGSDVAIQASDLTVVGNDLRQVADAIRLSRRTLGTIKQNLVWAFGYNVAAIPVAAAGLLSPMLAGAAMAFSSVFVVLNSLRLRSFGRGRLVGRSD